MGRHRSSHTRGATTHAILVALVVLLVGTSAARADAPNAPWPDLLPPLLAAWTANIVFVGLGVSLLLRART